MTGAKVNAEGEHPGTYYWKGSTTLALASDDTTNTHTITITGGSKSSSDKWSGTYDSIIDGKSAITNADASIKFKSGESFSITTDCKFDITFAFIPMSSSNWTLTATAEGFEDTKSLVKANQYTYQTYSKTDLDLGTYTFSFGKETHVYEILVVQKSSGSIDDLANAAATAIGNIGTVTYSEGSNTKIILARNAINSLLKAS